MLQTERSDGVSAVDAAVIVVTLLTAVSAKVSYHMT
jgi:hypothetical protein